MKLKKILKYFDPNIPCTIEADTGLYNPNWEILYEGTIGDIPWRYSDCNLTPANDNWDVIEMCTNDKEQGYLNFTIVLKD
jgi:hypothetical protein